MNRCFLIVACLMLLYGQIPAGENTLSNSEDIIIYYGLNGSNSNSWVRENNNGVVGISYFQRFDGNNSEGTLIYKTINPTVERYDRTNDRGGHYKEIINTDVYKEIEVVTTGARLEKSVLLYDSIAAPHIFVTKSNNTDQVIDHYFKNNEGHWLVETIMHFYNEGGKFIYEISAESGPDNSFHLLILKTRSDVDSDDFMDCWINSHLYHITNVSGSWQKELIYNYDMAWTYDMYIKTSRRQDIKIDEYGYVHVVFGEQIASGDYPSRLNYATNQSGDWVVETAMSYDFGSRDDAGWFPSLAFDTLGLPHISCMYVHRVSTGSAVYCKLFYLQRLGTGYWHSSIIADSDDGYYGNDGRRYTGGLSHLIFDNENKPHLIFSDIASSHWGGQNKLLTGNIRYGVFEDGAWDIRTIYRQPLPTSFLSATEMHGMCLIVSDLTDSIRVIGQELEVVGSYLYSCRLVEFAWGRTPTDVEEEHGDLLPSRHQLSQNYPNPFNPATSIEFDLPRRSQVALSVYNLLGQQIKMLVDDKLPSGNHSIEWNGTDSRGRIVPTGIYFYRFQAGEFVETKKMMLLK